MKATLDLEQKGLRLSGQPLLLTTNNYEPKNPLACCTPGSTSTSSFLSSNAMSSFLPFFDILWVEPTNSGKPNEVEITYAYPFLSQLPNLKEEFILPYEDAKRSIYPATQILTIQLENQNVFKQTDDLINIILQNSYPNYFKQSSSIKFNPQSILVLINPHSGKGEAVDIYNKEVKPILESAHCQLTVQLTEYSGHAMEIARNVNIQNFDTILCASGDGIPYEVINGFYKREDRADAFSKINIVQTPGGSGNAMSLSCLGATSASLAALRILKGKSAQCDLMAISKESNDETIVSFLSQTYGAIAQADIGTEWIRPIGSIRFDLGVAYEVIARHKYPCDLAVKLKCKDNHEICNHYKNHLNENNNNENSLFDSTKNSTYKDSISTEIDNTLMNSKLIKLTEEDFKLKYVENFKNSTSFNNLPDDWEIYNKGLTDNMRIFYAGKMPYIAATTNFFPAALPADGSIDVVAFDFRSNFVSTANALLSLEKGTHVWEDCVEHFKVEAYRLIPRAHKECFISVDGEVFPYEPFQVEILKGVLRTILWEDTFTDTGYLYNRA